MEPNYFEILEVPVDASDEQIRKAYKKLALRFHPDKNNNDLDAVEKFKKIAEAHKTLSDPKKKKRYIKRFVEKDNSEGDLRQGKSYPDTSEQYSDTDKNGSVYRRPGRRGSKHL